MEKLISGRECFLVVGESMWGMDHNLLPDVNKGSKTILHDKFLTP